MLILNVPFNEKDDAKKLGAKWNPKIKKWYADSDYHLFIRWISDSNFVVLDNLYIYIIKRMCPTCKKETNYIYLAIDKYLEFYYDIEYYNDLTDEEREDFLDETHYYYSNDELNIVSDIDYLPKYIKEYLQNKFNFKKYKKNQSYNNFCDHCNKFLRDRSDHIIEYNIATCEKLILKNDFSFRVSISFSSDDDIPTEKFKINKKYEEVTFQ